MVNSRFEMVKSVDVKTSICNSGPESSDWWVETVRVLLTSYKGKRVRMKWFTTVYAAWRILAVKDKTSGTKDRRSSYYFLWE